MTIIILSIQLWLEEISIIKNFEIFNKIICRTLLNCTAMDIMYYTSPLFRMEIWSALQFELNRLYQMFTQRNPTFEANGGKVSIVSHSLGNSISFHIGIRIFPLLFFSLSICLLVIMSAFHSENPYVNSGLFYYFPKRKDEGIVINWSLLKNSLIWLVGTDNLRFLGCWKGL